MSTGYSVVEWANQALDHLGKPDILSLTENSEAARQVNKKYERVLHAVLARSPWTFSRGFISLASVTNDWDERWAYKYDYPSDAARIVRLVPSYDPPNSGIRVPYQILGGAIYTNELEAKAEYVVKTSTTLEKPVEFLTAASFLLARELAMPLTRKQSIWGDMNQSYEYHLRLAIESDAGQEMNSWVEGNDYVEARGGAPYEIEGPAPDGSVYWSS